MPKMILALPGRSCCSVGRRVDSGGRAVGGLRNASRPEAGSRKRFSRQRRRDKSRSGRVIDKENHDE